ncbi:hypothetical protein B0H66DRAFT_348449 [Apodospora peruviana]|uniref:Uncharacterized protein n=1 Tax=Apodospora peruviana TaxID=516989 RepID=A0AAE0LZG5_9PEZI|nr:hypothetical protein B0H66DRAFT_348449 [Apodospora peruviana]
MTGFPGSVSNVIPYVIFALGGQATHSDRRQHKSTYTSRQLPRVNTRIPLNTLLPLHRIPSFVPAYPYTHTLFLPRGLGMNDAGTEDGNPRRPADGSPEEPEEAVTLNNVSEQPDSRKDKRIILVPSATSRRFTSTQSIPCRNVRSPQRLLEVLETKYGKDGYNVEMRHNVYTVTISSNRTKLSQDEIRDC